MKLVYIIGGMCSGKSSVLRAFESFGAYAIDFDIWAKDILNSSTAKDILINTEFENYFGSYGICDKQGFSNFLFENKSHLEIFNNTFFPIIKNRLDKHLLDVDSEVIAIEYSAWDGTNRDKDIFLSSADVVIGVVCDNRERENRIKKKSFDVSDYYKRASMQPDEEELRIASDYTIDNSLREEDLKRECAKLWSKCCK